MLHDRDAAANVNSRQAVTVIDGNARSAEWRKKQRAAQRPQAPDPPEATTGVPADFDPAAAKDFVSSLMIPANQLGGATRENPAAPEAPDAYIDKLLDGSREEQPRQELENEARGSSADSDELDRWFEEQATSIPNLPAGQALPRGSASLDIETAGVGAERTRRGRALRLRLRIARARENRQQRRQPAGRRPLHARAHVTGLRVLVGTTLTVLPVAAIAIATSGSPAKRAPISTATASTSTAFPGLLDTFMTEAKRLPGINGLSLRAQQHRRQSDRIRRAPRRRPITHPHRSTGAAASSSYTPRPTSQTDNSPAPAASAASSTSSGGGSTASNSSPPPRTGPSGPISLIGAGTTPSG